MTPEEKARLVAETDKLLAETASLKKGGWGRPSSWIPMFAAVAAFSTSIGQFQVSSINEKEAALDAREKVVEAKEEESRLVERNFKLEERANALTDKIAASTADSVKLKEEIQKANNQLLALAQKLDTTGALTASVEKGITERTEKAATIVASARKRNDDAQISSLVWQMNSDVKQTRKDAVGQLIAEYGSDQTAISLAIDLITMPQLETMSASGRINVLVFLRNTDPSAWNEESKDAAVSAIKTIRTRAKQGKAFIGSQTKEALTTAEKWLEQVE
jgi:hypothetical protein